MRSGFDFDDALVRFEASSVNWQFTKPALFNKKTLHEPTFGFNIAFIVLLFARI